MKSVSDQDIKFKTELHYYFDDLSKSFTTLAKRGHRMSFIPERPILTLLSKMKVEKRKKSLSLRFGINWKEQSVFSLGP